MSLDIFAPFLSCLGLTAKPRKQPFAASSYEPKYTDGKPADEDDKVELEASSFVSLLLHANTTDLNDPQLRASLNDCISTCGWREKFAQLVLNILVAALKKGIVLGQAAKKAAEKARAAAVDFAKEHPVYCTIIALGILVVLAPYLIELLGFGAEGPIAETFASAWQARYAGYVPKGALFTYLQRLGMVWRLKLKL